MSSVSASTVSSSPKPKPKVPARPSVDREDSPAAKPKPKDKYVMYAHVNGARACERV